MTEPKTQTLDVPGATLTYDLRGNVASAAPVLLMIGSPMGAAGFGTLAGHFTDRSVATYDLREAAQRIGVSTDDLGRLCDLGILTPDDEGRFTPGHLRRAGLVTNLVAAGIPLEGLGEAIRSGQVSLDFLDAPAFERFSSLSGDTFAEVAIRTGVPVELLLFVREASGSMAAAPGDRIRDEEIVYAELLAESAIAGIRPAATQQQSNPYILRTAHQPANRMPAEEAVDPFQDDVRFVLDLQRRRPLDPQHQRRGLLRLALDRPRPLHLQRFGMTRHVGARDLRPARDQFARGKALLGIGVGEDVAEQDGERLCADAAGSGHRDTIA